MFLAAIMLTIHPSIEAYKFWFGMVEIWYGQVVYTANFIRAEPSFWNPCHFHPSRALKSYI